MIEKRQPTKECRHELRKKEKEKERNKERKKSAAGAKKVKQTKREKKQPRRTFSPCPELQIAVHKKGKNKNKQINRFHMLQ